MQSQRHSDRSRRAFTIIEILIVVFILSVLAALVVPRVLSAMTDSKIEASKARASEILTMIVRYNQFHPGAKITLVNGPIADADLNKLVEAQYCTAADLVNQADASKGWSYQGDRVIPTP